MTLEELYYISPDRRDLPWDRGHLPIEALAKVGPVRIKKEERARSPRSQEVPMTLEAIA